MLEILIDNGPKNTDLEIINATVKKDHSGT
jgi:hypothetical protein